MLLLAGGAGAVLVGGWAVLMTWGHELMVVLHEGLGGEGGQVGVVGFFIGFRGGVGAGEENVAGFVAGGGLAWSDWGF